MTFRPYNKNCISVEQLKNDIYRNHEILIPVILNKLGCYDIEYHDATYQLDANFTACNPDGEKSYALMVFCNKHLSVSNFTRNFPGTDLIGAVQYYKKMDFKSALKYLKDVVDNTDISKISLESDDIDSDLDWLNYTEGEIESEPKPEPEQMVLPESELTRYEPILYIGWLREGIMPWTREKFDIRYSYDEKRIIVPIRHYQTGKLMGLTKRTTIDDEDPFMLEMLDIPKYENTKGFKKSINVYGLWENKESIKKSGYCVIFEAPKSVLKRYSLKDETGVALLGHDLSSEQVKILIEQDVDIVLAMDKDVRLNEVRYMCSKFYENEQFRKNHKIYYLLDKWNLLGEKDSPADASDKNFQKLMKNKIEYDWTEHEIWIDLLGSGIRK